MTISILKNASNGSVIVHASSNGSIVLTGNDSVSNIAAPGEYVIGSRIKQVWTGSSSGGTAYWVISKGNTSANVIAGVYDSTAWIDYAGNGFALNIAEDGESLYFTINGTPATGYVMVELKKVVGPAP